MSTQKKSVNEFLLSASLICGQPLNLEKDIKLLEKGGIDYIHFDVMDGMFVPRFGLYPEILSSVTRMTKIPVDVHLMVDNPEPYLEIFAKAGAKIISVHAESTEHLHRVVQKIHKLGVKAGVALNPATGLNVLEYLWEDIDLVMLMAINPGIVGHKLIPSSLRKIRETAEIAKLRNPKLIIQVDGGVSWESGPQMVELGANMLVCGTSTIFNQQKRMDKMIIDYRNEISRYFK